MVCRRFFFFFFFAFVEFAAFFLQHVFFSGSDLRHFVVLLAVGVGLRNAVNR